MAKTRSTNEISIVSLIAFPITQILALTSIIPTMLILHMSVNLPLRALLPTAPTPVLPARRTFHMVTSAGLLDRNSTLLIRTMLNILRILRIELTSLTNPIAQFSRSSSGTHAFEVLLCVTAGYAPGVDPLSSFVDGGLEVTDSVDAHSVFGKGSAGRGSATKGAGEGGGVDDSSSGVETIPALQAVSADALIAA
jgi:hypothetical protein